VGRSGKSGTGFVSLCREIMSRFIQLHFPTRIEGNVSIDLKLCEDNIDLL